MMRFCLIAIMDFSHAEDRADSSASQSALMVCKSKLRQYLT